MAKKDRRIKYESDTEKPVMVSVRLPRELYDRLERYASQHQQSISELLKDGAEMRLETEVDPRYRRTASTADATELQIDGANILRDMQTTLARHETQMHALMQAIERQTTPTGNGLSENASYNVIHSHVATDSEAQERAREQEPASNTVPNVLQAAQNPALANVEAVTFDTTKYRLGKLCPQGHDYQGTGQSLRVNNKAGYCKACNAEQQREGRARRGQQKPQATA